MADQAELKQCLVCGDIAVFPTAAEQQLTCSKSTIAEFLVGYNVIGVSREENVGDLDGEPVCKLCFEMIKNCDEWNYVVGRTLDALREKAAANGRHKNVSARVISKVEVVLEDEQVIEEPCGPFFLSTIHVNEFFHKNVVFFFHLKERIINENKVSSNTMFTAQKQNFSQKQWLSLITKAKFSIKTKEGAFQTSNLLPPVS